MNIIYRYLRPSKFNSHRIDLETSAYGGICLRFEEHEDKVGYWFTYAVCDANELFSKETAKAITNQRAAIIDPTVRNLIRIERDPSLVWNALAFCRDFAAMQYPPIAVYHMQELRQLGLDILLITAHNAREEQKHRDWIATQEAVHVTELYANR